MLTDTGDRGTIEPMHSRPPGGARSRRAALIVALAMLHVGTAHADRTAVVVHGAANPRARSVVANAFRSALAVAGWQIANPLADRDDKVIADCSARERPWACIAPVVQSKAIDRVVVVSVEPDGSDANFVLTASLVVAGSSEPARSREPCQSCSDTLLEQTARGLATTIVSHAQRFARTTLAITTEPRGAAISIDGEPQGASPSTIVTTPGAHTVVVEQPGFVTATRRIELESGKETLLDVRLAIEPTSGHTRPKWPLILVGAGLAMAATGTIISLQVDPPPPTEPQPKYLYSVPAIAVAVVGGLAVAAGLALWFRPGSGSPTVAATSDGGAVGWATAF